MEIFDNEPIQKLIEVSVPTILDTTQYEPATMPKTVLQVEPSDTTVNTQSQWTLSLSSTVPLATECYIKLLFPLDLEYDFQSITGSGIFLPKNLQAILSTDAVSISPGTTEDPRISVVFFGCNQDASLGAQPFGSAMISDITTQKAIKDSDDFGLEIYKDEDLTQKIAVMEAGVFVPAATMSPGFLYDLELRPLISTVQVSSLLYVTFLSSHNLYTGAKVEIVMPAGLQLPDDGTEIEVTPLGGSTRATTAVIKDGTTVVIENFVSVAENVAPYLYTFALSDIANQISAKDAGGYSITTYYLASDAQYYVVDT